MTMLGKRHASTDTEQALGILRAKNIEVAKQLKAEDAKKWTQAKIAVALGVSQKTVDLWLGSINNSSTTKTNTDARLSIPAGAMKGKGGSVSELPFAKEVIAAYRKLAKHVGAERAAGALLREMELHNGDPRSHDVTRLGDLGITKMQSSRWQTNTMLGKQEVSK